MRLFIAIDLPGSLQRKIADFKQELPGSKWVPSDQLHLTLRFIGEADDEMAQKIRTSLNSIQPPPLTLKLKGLGCFPNERLPRVLWVGIQINQELEELQKRIEQKLQEIGIDAEKRPFVPHITLARFKSYPKGIENFLKKNGGFSSDLFEITEFYLYSSILSPKGAIHEKIGTFGS